MSQSHNPVPHTPPPLPPGFASGPSLHAAPGQPSAGGHFNSSMGPAFPPAFEVPPGAGRPAGKTRPGSGLSRGIVAWGVAAAAAVAYLSVVVMRPDLVARFNGGGASVAEIETLRGEVDGLRRDMASVRSLVGETASQQKVIVDRLAALGAPVGSPVPVSDGTTPPPALRLDSVPVNGPMSPRADAAASPSAVVPSAGAARSIADAKVLNAKPELETGSVKPVPQAAPAPAATPAAASNEPPPFAAPVVTPAAKPVGVQIASGSSIDSLRLSWNLLSETHADKLKNLEPRYSLSVDNGAVVYNLMAGPVKSAADAKKMCKALAAKAIPCKVVDEFGGAAL